MHKFLTLLEGGIIGAALLIIFDHVGKIHYASFQNRCNHVYSRPTYYRPYRNFRNEEEEEDE